MGERVETMLNLHEIGAKYVKGWDESRVGRERDPWLMTLVARKGRGHVYMHSEAMLGAATTRKLGRRVADEVTGSQIWQDGDDGINVIFPVASLDAVC